MRQPIKVIHDKRLSYLMNLETSYKEMGYTTKLDGFKNLLEVYPAGYVVPKTVEELVIDRWID